MDFKTENNGQGKPIAILASGGLDSAVLIGLIAKNSSQPVWPIYIRCGLNWEKTEIALLQKFLHNIDCLLLQPLTLLDLPVRDIYGDHWSLTGQGIPDGSTPDEAVFLPGRNVLLTIKAALWCHLNKVPHLAIGLLKGNPFPDASEPFFNDLMKTLNQSVDGNVQILIPFANHKKAEVIMFGKDFPLEFSFSCINPSGLLHCGNCNKCVERKSGFITAGLMDPTTYAKDKNV